MGKRRQNETYFEDERASVTIFAVVTFAFLMTFSGLIFDVGRIFNLHSQSQAYADQVALAAAAELDGESGAIDRAIRAVNTTDASSFIDAGFRLGLSNDNAVDVASLTFLSEIAPDPAEPNTRQPLAGDTVLCTWTGGADDCVAEDDGEAAFVLATVTTETENYLMFPIVGGLVPGMVDEASVQPQALAGFTRQICNFPPMAFCNPSEDPNPPHGGDFTVGEGQQILLQTQGAGASWAPGNFGFLDLTEVGSNACSGGGANFLRCMLGLINPNTQCVSAEVDMNPGQTTSADAGINVRFGIYDPPLHNDTGNLAFAPDLNVTKGFVRTGGPNACGLSDLESPEDVTPALDPSDYTTRLPRDPGISVTNRIGPGLPRADLEAYWALNNPTVNGGILPLHVNTRYQAYLEEIATTIPNKSAQGGENGNPECGTAPVPDRRRIVVAVINCLEHNVQGSSNDVPVINFLEMFLTEEAGDPNDASEHDIYAEVISVVQPGGLDGVLHEFPVLYR